MPDNPQICAGQWVTRSGLRAVIWNAVDIHGQAGWKGIVEGLDLGLWYSDGSDAFGVRGLDLDHPIQIAEGSNGEQVEH